MGAIINTVHSSVWDPASSYGDRGADAVKKCLEDLPKDFKALDVLISTGIYTDEHIHEPAFASLIQGNLSRSFAEKLKGTFSFDLHNGGGGSLMAMRLLHGFLASGKIRYGVIVAGDSPPESGPAGALLLGLGKDGEGFQAFVQDSYPEYGGDYESYAAFSGEELRTFIHQEDAYVEHVLHCVEKSVLNFLSDLALDLQEIDLILASPHPPGFSTGLAALFGKKRLIQRENTQTVYSAGLLLALAEAHTRGILHKSKRILFIHAGPGILVELALYQNPGWG